MDPTIDEYLNKPCRRIGAQPLNGTARNLQLVTPPKIAFPDAQEIERAHQQAAVDERMAEAVNAAWQNGHAQGLEEGYRLGYKPGTHWGMFCGAVGAVAIVALVTLASALLIGATHTG
jgi:flagellar biosynthesis/type III secretory pathway protein FliH